MQEVIASRCDPTRMLKQGVRLPHPDVFANDQEPKQFLMDGHSLKVLIKDILTQANYAVEINEAFDIGLPEIF